MTTLRRFTAEDLFHFNNVNLDHLTETVTLPRDLSVAANVVAAMTSRWLQYNIPFYMQYLARWPNLCLVAEAPGGEIMGYRACPISCRCIILKRLWQTWAKWRGEGMTGAASRRSRGTDTSPQACLSRAPFSALHSC